MGDVLVYIDPSADGAGRERLLAFARPLADHAGGALVALVASAESPPADGLAAADIVLEVTHPALSPYLPEAHQAVLHAVITTRAPELVLLENTTSGIDLAGAAAAAADLPFVGYCLDVTHKDGEVESTSALYGGQVLATVSTPLPAVLTINTAALPNEPPAAGRAERIPFAAPGELERLRTAFVEAVSPDGGVDIAKADRLVCVGRGIGGPENIESAMELASALDAELAASRPVVDSGWVPKARQVGKSGLTVEPKVYLALGVSGAPEHIEGMQRAELIIAVNKDPGAAIFNVAHYGAVADLFDVAEELTVLLEDGAT